MENYKLRYYVMPDFVMADNRLTLLAVKTYCFINTYTNRFYFSNEQIAETMGVSATSITKVIALLRRLEYIKTTYKLKANGGKMRYIDNLKQQAKESSDTYSEQVSRLTPNKSRNLDIGIKDNKIKDNKIKGESILSKTKNLFKKEEIGVPITTGESLSIGKPNKYSSPGDLDMEAIQSIASKYNVPESFVASKYDDLLNWTGSKGKKYKNYYLALCNWVKHDAIEVINKRQKEDRYVGIKAAIDASYL